MTYARFQSGVFLAYGIGSLLEDMIYNIRPAAFYSSKASFKPFNNEEEFITALFATQTQYRGSNFMADYQQSKQKMGLD